MRMTPSHKVEVTDPRWKTVHPERPCTAQLVAQASTGGQGIKLWINGIGCGGEMTVQRDNVEAFIAEVAQKLRQAAQDDVDIEHPNGRMLW